MEKHEFQPKEWVLVRDLDEQKWKLDIFSHYIEGNMYPYRCVSANYVQCIPYEGNEHLLGKKDTPEEKHVWHAGDRVDVLSEFDGMWHSGFIIEIDYTRGGRGFYYRVDSECFKGITSDGKAWCKADQLRKPEGKSEWRPKGGEFIEVLCEGEWKSGKLLEDDHSYVPFYVRIEDGEKGWFSEDKVRPAGKEKEKDSPFKFGDRVEASIDGEWCEAVVIEIDHSDIPYKVATADGDVRWCAKSRIRRA